MTSKPPETRTPLHLLEPGTVYTSGRAGMRNEERTISNAHATVVVATDEPWRDGALVRVRASFDQVLEATHVEWVTEGRVPALARRREFSLSDAVRSRSELNRAIRSFFEERSFLEVETQALVSEPGTDVHLDPIVTELRDHPGAQPRATGYLHTSPEFSMKRLLCAGFERIYQLGKVWRNGEVSHHHNPEFTMLEWYRAWSGVESIIDDTEALVRSVLPDRFTAYGPSGPVEVRLDREIKRWTMQEVVQKACGFDILECLEFEQLSAAIADKRLFDPSAATSWADLFAELQITTLDPFLARQRAIFVTHWPAPVAVLARRDPDDPRQSERFELYVGGLELANGFGELTDSGEQRERFAEDDAERVRRRLPRLPIPESFLEDLRDGMPPSAGVALGVDRLLMLMTGAKRMSDIAPFAIRGDQMGRWTFP